MKPQWISAPQALLLLGEISGGVIGKWALLSRVRAGQLKSNARLLNIEGDSRADVNLKKEFWHRTPYSEFEEHWEVGDFVAIHDGLYHHAIGVAFDLAGLSEMLPAERRPELARRCSVAGSSEWITAKAARAFMYAQLNAAPTSAAALLLDKCRLGFVAGRAVLRQQTAKGDPDSWDIEEREWDVPAWFWENFTAQGSSTQDWERGVFAGQGQWPGGHVWITLTGVYFYGPSIDALRPGSGETKSVETSGGPGNPGRPPAEFWDDLLCAIWGDIYRGDFKPKNQADVTKAMLDWASSKDHELSETSAKSRARKLMAQYRSEGKNQPE